MMVFLVIQVCFEGGVFRRGCKPLSATKKAAPEGAAFSSKKLRSSALTGFEPALRLIDDVNAAFATHNTAIAMPILERAERIANLHGRLLMSWRGPAPGLRATCQRQVDE